MRQKYIKETKIFF